MWWFTQNGKALSRWLNAFLGGEGDTTFSAYSYYLLHNGSIWGKLRVAIVDTLLSPGHCYDAYIWHKDRRLFEIDK